MRIWRNKSLSYLIKRWIADGGEGCARWPDQIASGNVTVRWTLLRTGTQSGNGVQSGVREYRIIVSHLDQAQRYQFF
jgi:hypothetical protein